VQFFLRAGLVASLFSWVACASVSKPIIADLSDVGDLTDVPVDLAVHDQGRPSDLSPPPVDLFGLCDQLQLKVNELQTGSTSSTVDEWVELFNPCTRNVPLDGASLVYRSATNGTPNDTSTIANLHGTMLPSSYYVVSNTGASVTSNQVFMAGNDLNAIGGAVGLRDRNGTLADSVGWGSANNTFVETSSVNAPMANKSVGRVPNGTDTQNNSTDFAPTSVKTPGAAN